MLTNIIFFGVKKLKTVLICIIIICLFRKHSPYKSLQNIDII